MKKYFKLSFLFTLLFILFSCATTNSSSSTYVKGDDVDYYYIPDEQIVNKLSLEKRIWKYDSFGAYGYSWQYDGYFCQGSFYIYYGRTKEGYERLQILLQDGLDGERNFFEIYNYSSKISLLKNYQEYDRNKSNYYDVKNLVLKHYSPVKNNYSPQIVDNEIYNVHKLCYFK